MLFRSRTLTPDLVSKLGPKTLARYAGELKIDATARDLMTEQNWSNLQTLNNYRNISINLDYGVPSTLNAGQTLSDVMSKMTYQQFMGGYNLLSSISIKSAPVDLVPTNYDASTKTQTFQFSGLFLNGDSVKLSLLGKIGRAHV